MTTIAVSIKLRIKVNRCLLNIILQREKIKNQSSVQKKLLKSYAFSNNGEPPVVSVVLIVINYSKLTFTC